MIRYIFSTCFLLVVLFLSTIAFAECPIGVQKTVVIYLNGVDTTEESAMLSRNRIKKEIAKIPDVLVDCIKYDYLYNVNEKLFGDLIEAGLQKAKEQNLSASDFWRWLFRLNPFTSGFSDLIFDYYSNTNAFIDLGLFVLGDQVAEHLAKIREYLRQGKNVIIVSHSQGNLYINEEWNALTSTERSKINVVAVATPADHTSGNGPYTTLVEDKVAELFFPQALAANVANDESCPDDWTCHGFKESYMKGKNSRLHIIEEIISFLPVVQENCRIEGTIYDWDYEDTISDGRVELWVWDSSGWKWKFSTETKSNSSGHYCFANISDGNYLLDGYNKNEEWLGEKGAWLQPNQIAPIVIDFPIAYPM